MIYRTYFSKDATLNSGSPYNSGSNPILKLSKGDTLLNHNVSRFVIDFNLDNLRNKISTKEIPDNRKHIIRMYNTMYYNRDIMGYTNILPVNLPASFDIDIYIINDEWDEGRGYDYLKDEISITHNTPLFLKNGVTFNNRKTNIQWDKDKSFTFYKTFSFDTGIENIEFDVTDLIEEVINGTIENFNGLMFKLKDEDGSENSVIEFYGKSTHTFFEPHIETSWDETIIDNRYDLGYNEEHTLYFYSNLNGKLVNTDDIANMYVTIYNEYDEVIDKITNIKHEKLGIYSIKVTIPKAVSDISNYFDAWTYTYKGRRYTVENKFICSSDSTTFNSKPYETLDYGISTSGIMNKESIPNNEVRKITVHVKQYYGYDSVNIEDILLDLYIKHGNQKVYIMESCKMNYYNDEFYCYLDTEWLIPQDYSIDIRAKVNGEIKNHEKIDFTILNSKLINSINNI